MKLGIKVGPNPQDIPNLELTNAPYCEVWFNINEVSTYDPLFAFLTKRPMEVGLHFWGCLSDGTWTNFAYPDTELINASIDLIQKTIDIAALHKFQYVNIHPGTRTKTKIDFVRQEFELRADPVDLSVAEQLFLEHAKKLHDYAANRGVVFIVETVPQREARGWYNPNARATDIMNISELPIETLIKAAHQGIWIANDFCHTAANKISSSRDEVIQFLTDTTDALFSQTRLIHVGFLVPPYNGTDFHDQLDNPLLGTDQAVPNRNELKQLLEPFRKRDDVWAIVEPLGEHPKNYFLLQKLLAQK